MARKPADPGSRVGSLRPDLPVWLAAAGVPGWPEPLGRPGAPVTGCRSLACDHAARMDVTFSRKAIHHSGGASAGGGEPDEWAQIVRWGRLLEGGVALSAGMNPGIHPQPRDESRDPSLGRGRSRRRGRSGSWAGGGGRRFVARRSQPACPAARPVAGRLRGPAARPVAARRACAAFAKQRGRWLADCHQPAIE